jgi:hypothetical protein
MTTPTPTPTPDLAPTPDPLAGLESRLAARLAGLLDARRDELIADLGWLERHAVAAFWPRIVAEAETLAHAALAHLSAEFGGTTFAEGTTRLAAVLGLDGPRP